MSHQLFCEIQRARINHRWLTATPEERRLQNQRMVAGKKAKAAERAAARGDVPPPPAPLKPLASVTPPALPLSPSAASSQQPPVRRSHERSKTNPLLPVGIVAPSAPVAITYPTMQQVLGAPIEQLVSERINAQPDVANLDYYELEYRKSIVRQELHVEYLELIGQPEKAWVCNAQLRKSLEQSTQQRRNETSQKSRENREALEAEYFALCDQLIRVEVDAMTDADLEIAMKSPLADIAVDSDGDNGDVDAMTTAELKAEIARKRAELDRHDAGNGGVPPSRV